MNKVTFEQEPDLFSDIVEFTIESINDHRRGDTFFRKDIIEFKLTDSEYYPKIDNFEQYVGTWKTNKVIWSDGDGFDEGFSKLTRVEKVEQVSHTWENVKKDKDE